MRSKRPWLLHLPISSQALRREAAADTAVSGGEGEDLKEAGGLRPPASFKTSPLPRLDSLLGTLTRAGGGPPLRYGLLREGQGWGWSTTTAVRHAPVARP